MKQSKYSLKQKEEWCKAYLKGEYVPTPIGVSRPTFIHELRDWARKYNKFGIDAIDSSKRNTYTKELKIEIVQRIKLGDISIKEAARTYNIKERSSIRSWIKKYSDISLDILESLKQGVYYVKEGKPTGAQSQNNRVGETTREDGAREYLLKKLEYLGRKAGIESRNKEKAEVIRLTREQFPKV